MGKQNIYYLFPNIYCSSDESILTSGGGEEENGSVISGVIIRRWGAKNLVNLLETDGINPDKGNKDEYYNFKTRKNLNDEGLKIVFDASQMTVEKLLLI